jgi:Uncharacterized homolog of PSP1
MRQINIRDECKILGGIGVCGRVCCCNSIVNEMNAVTSKITKTAMPEYEQICRLLRQAFMLSRFRPAGAGRECLRDEYAAAGRNEEESLAETETGEKKETEAEEAPAGAFTDDGYEK